MSNNIVEFKNPSKRPIEGFVIICDDKLSSDISFKEHADRIFIFAPDIDTAAQMYKKAEMMLKKNRDFYARKATSGRLSIY